MAISVTSRDRLLLSKLASYGVLSSGQIEEIQFEKVRKTTMLRRLRKLRRAGLIERTTGLPCGEHAWHVTQRGAAKVGEPDSTLTVSKNTLEHAVEVSGLRIELERHQAAHGWIAEHELKRQWGIEERRRTHEFTVVPDALFAAVSQGETRILSLELELHAKGRRLYRKLFEKYPKHVPIWKVWYVVSDPKVAKVVMSVWKEMAPNDRKDWIVWSRLSDIKDDLSTARVHSLLGSLPISKWIALDRDLSPDALEKTRTNPAQPPAHSLSIEGSSCESHEIGSPLPEQEVIQNAESAKNSLPGQHSGEFKRGPYEISDDVDAGGSNAEA